MSDSLDEPDRFGYELAQMHLWARSAGYPERVERAGSRVGLADLEAVIQVRLSDSGLAGHLHLQMTTHTGDRLPTSLR